MTMISELMGDPNTEIYININEVSNNSLEDHILSFEQLLENYYNIFNNFHTDNIQLQLKANLYKHFIMSINNNNDDRFKNLSRELSLSTLLLSLLMLALFVAIIVIIIHK